MVASINAAYGSGYGYPPASQAVTVTVQTEQDTLAAQLSQGGSRQTLTASSYSESVTISIGQGSSTNASSLTSGALQAQTQSGQQALATVEQTATEARDFLKNDAKKKLAQAEAELKLLKLLGNSAAGAKEAAQIAREIADAATQYAEGGGAADAAATGTSSTGADATAASAPAASSQNAAAQGAAGQSATAPTNAAAGSAAAGTAAALTPAQQDPFYQSVEAALAELKKYLQKTLPALETSSDKKTRKTAKEVAESFDQSLVQVADAEATFNAESAPGGGAADATAALGGGDSAAAAAATAVAASYQSVNLTV